MPARGGPPHDPPEDGQERERVPPAHEETHKPWVATQWGSVMNEARYLAVAEAVFIRDVWDRAIITWAHSQVSRRVALRCAQCEQEGINILLTEGTT
jgi:hypothetical protein